jgi:serine/threonine protein kinase
VQLGEALAAAHACNIIHRDVKPSNCFIVEAATQATIS